MYLVCLAINKHKTTAINKYKNTTVKIYFLKTKFTTDTPFPWEH